MPDPAKPVTFDEVLAAFERMRDAPFEPLVEVLHPDEYARRLADPSYQVPIAHRPDEPDTASPDPQE